MIPFVLGLEQAEALLCLEVVYSPEMAEKSPTLAVLHERLGTAIKLGAGAVVVAAGIALFFLFRVIDHGEKLVALQTSIDDMKRTLEPIVAEQRLKSAALLPQKDFGRRLKEVKRAIELAGQAHVPPPDDSIQEIRARLLTVSADDPAYWQTTAAFITYRTGGVERSRILPPCEHVRPKIEPGKTPVEDLSGKVLSIITGPMVHRGCTLLLDEHEIMGHTFENCFIVYRGAPLHLKNVHFENCFFDIEVRERGPSPAGKDFILALLGSNDLRNITISAG